MRGEIMNISDLKLTTRMVGNGSRTRIRLLQWLAGQPERFIAHWFLTRSVPNDAEVSEPQSLLTDNQMEILNMVLGGFGRTPR
jgi:hypothetical protein